MPEERVDYLARIHREPHPLLLELEQQGIADGVPVVSRGTGRLLSTVVHAMQANRILEIGTAYGYSTLWMALAQPPAGKIWTIDPNIERTQVAMSYLERAGEADYVTVVNQSALEFLPSFPHRNLDIVFIDADKRDYERYLELAIPLLKLSGLVILDDLLWDGKAPLEPAHDDSEETKAIRSFNKVFLTHPQLDATILPLGDGTGIGARIQ